MQFLWCTQDFDICLLCHEPVGAALFLCLWHLPLPSKCFPHLLYSCFTGSCLQHTETASHFQQQPVVKLLFVDTLQQKEAQLELMCVCVQDRHEELFTCCPSRSYTITVKNSASSMPTTKASCLEARQTEFWDAVSGRGF